MLHSLMVLGLFAVQIGAPPSEEPERPTLRAERLRDGSEITLDGRLDEAAWNTASPAQGFRQREPREGVPASETTEVRVLYDRHNLYVGVTARDSRPKEVIARILQRDRLMVPDFDGRHEFAGDDGVVLVLDPFYDRRNAVVFATNPNGAEFEALITDESPRLNVDWRAVWSVRAARTKDGWSAEFEIPFRTLRYPAGAGATPWGFNVYRMIRRKSEQVLWAGWSREEGGFYRVSRAGDLLGLEQLPRRGFNLELKPYGLAGLSQEQLESAPPAIDSDAEIDAGVDLKWEVSPGLVLDATLNPDFAQVEADQEEINLTRFDLFFPEKRDFFLENAGVFEFGTRGFDEPPPFLLFFSRTIGIVDGEETPVWGGVRLTGRAGRQTLGFLDVVTGNANAEPTTNYGVLRVKRDLGASNYLGAMVTDRRSTESSNSTAGVDASFWPSGSLNLQGFFARTFTSGLGGEDDAYRVAVDYTGDRAGLWGEYLRIGPETNAEMGFITRTDMKRLFLYPRLTFRPEALGLRTFELFGYAKHVTRVDGEKQDLTVGPMVMVEWDSGEDAGAYYAGGYTRLDEPFDLSDRIPVPAGDYDNDNLGMWINTSKKRVVSAEFDAVRIDTYDGRLVTLAGSVTATPGSHLACTASLARNSATLPGGSFTAYVSALRLSWAFSTRLSASAYLQHNSLEDKFVANFRLNFVHRPGSDLFFVINEERGGDDRSAWDLANRGVVVKLTYLVRF